MYNQVNPTVGAGAGAVSLSSAIAILPNTGGSI
jgi:hypothetical protein